MKTNNITSWTLLCAVFIVLSGCQDDSVDGPSDLDRTLRDALKQSSNGIGEDYYRLPASDDFFQIPQDPKNPLTKEKVALGKLLFHETGLANVPKHTVSKGTYSCASCHFAAAGFQAGRQQGIGDGGSGFGKHGEARTANPTIPLEDCDVQPIRTPSAMNSAYQINTLWNGQFGATGMNAGTESAWTPGSPKEVNHLGFEGLESQAIAGLGVHRMSIDTATLLTDVYKLFFDQAFDQVPVNDRYSLKNAGLAIAAYERTLFANEAPFQKWLRGDFQALTAQEKEGALVFFQKSNCTSCHNGPALNSMEFYALGMKDLSTEVGAINVLPNDPAHLGRGSFTGVGEDNYKFKVPQLYNLKDSPFYGHGSSFNSVLEVIRYKNNALAENAIVPAHQVSPDFIPLNLTEEEMQQLTLFIENGLFDPNLKRYEPILLPSGNCFPNNDEQSKFDLGC